MAAIELVPDGTLDFSGGQNAALDPEQIAPNQYFYGINVSAEKKSLTPRWGLVQQKLDFSVTGNYTRTSGLQVSFEEVFRSGKFQAFIPYSIGPDIFVIYVVSGFVFLINVQTRGVTVLNPTDQVNIYADRINWSNAGEFLVIFDWPNNPFILDGVVIRRADPAKNEVPVSVLGTYNQNRLCIANAGIDWTAGDPSGSPSTPDAPITFNEVIVPSSPFVGDVYQIPTANKNNDFITAMGFLQVIDTSTGIGPLLVATSKSLYSYRTDLPRLSWQGGASGFVFGSMFLYSAGIVGQRAFININSDIIFLSPDGQVRALSMARNDQQRWGNSPISREVENFLEYIDDSIAFVAALAHFKNKVFITCNPYRVTCTSAEGLAQTDYVNAGVVVLETDNNSTLTNKTPPVWGGVWTGTGFLDYTENNKVFYVAGKYRGRNELYILDPTKTYDIIEDEVRNVRSVVLTREYINGDPTVNKELHTLDLGFRNLEEQVKVNVTYKPSTIDSYNYWRDLVFNAPVEQCQAFPDFPQGLQRQGIRDLNLGGVDENVCNVIEQNFMHIYKGVQLRLIITGKYWELQYIKLKGRVLHQTEVDAYCEEKAGVPIPAECFDIWAIPENPC